MSTPPPLHHLLRGPLHFLRADGDEIRRLAGDARLLPMPQRIYLEDESATPLYGFPILVSDELRSLSRALEEYVNAEEALQVAMIKRQTFDRRVYGSAWERYRGLLAKAIENVTISSYGRQHPAVFWLHQSLDVSRLLRETPKRIVRLDLAVGREHGDALKYLVLDKVLDRLFSLTYDVVHHLAENTYEVEDELFPAILTRMRDNVLIFSESHISSVAQRAVELLRGLPAHRRPRPSCSASTGARGVARGPLAQRRRAARHRGPTAGARRRERSARAAEASGLGALSLHPPLLRLLGAACRR